MLDESAHATHALTKASLTYISLIASGMAGAFSDRTGPRASALTGAFVSALALLVGSYSDDLRMLSIVQGAVQGVGVALVVVPAYVVPAHWFERHRALASGLSLAGTALGTACLTPALHALLSRHGMQTAMRVQALVALVSGSVGSAGLQTRVAVARPRKITWKVFYDMRLAVLALVALLAGASLTLQLLCLPGFAHLLGMAERLHAVYALGAAACVGLVAGGLVADRTGYIAGIGLSQLAMGVFTLALWLPARGPAVFFAYVVCYGLAIGVLGAVLPASIMQMFGIARAFTMLGIATMAAAVGVLATLPMAVEFQQRASQNRSVQFLIGIGGGLSILAGIAALLLPYLQRRHLVRVLNKSVWVE
ncbi:hypothetical protein EC988_005676 [Linderina pennispora]|nr:hypothetical protein EC988_005676 [Linderina pennispora]